MTTTNMTVEGLVIDGQKVAAADGRTIDVYDPSTGTVFTRVARAGRADVDRAVAAAARAMESPAWGGLEPAERGRILLDMAQTIRQRAEELATLESRDNGKPLRQARTDVQVAARYFEFYGGVADKIMGHTIPMAPGIVDFTLKEPIGVSAQIVPWNYPIQIGSRGVAPALAAGCAVVVKPSSEAPMTALRLGEIGLACGLPPGALNVVPGIGSEAGVALASHPGINQLTFTGSVEVGVAVAKMAAENVVPVVMELGGKSPNVVFADADMDLAAAGVAKAIFQNAGQTCSAGSRLLVERNAHDAFVDRLVAHTRSMKLGAGVDDPDMGPIISKRQLETIEQYVAVGQQEGARVAAVLPFDTIEEAVALANDSDYGLVAGVWTRDINKAMALATRIKSGQVFVNTYGAGGGVEMPFGGYKKSGYGREKSLEALASYTQTKNVCIKFA